MPPSLEKDCIPLPDWYLGTFGIKKLLYAHMPVTSELLQNRVVIISAVENN